MKNQNTIFEFYYHTTNMKVLVFGASYSPTSINQELAAFTTKYFTDKDVEILNINQYKLPVFTAEIDQIENPPKAIHNFITKIKNSDLVIISMAEHNASYTAAFKNLFDWSSVVEPKIFKNTKVVLLATSPGVRGAKNVLAQAIDRFPRHGAEIIGSLSLPEFDKNFTPEKGITNPAILKDFEAFFDGIINKLNIKKN